MDVTRLHPQARSAVQAQIREPLTVDGLPAVRRSIRDAIAVECGPGPQDMTVRNVQGARWYAEEKPGPVILYAHGGGWVMGDLDTHDALCRRLAKETGLPVLSVDYRLAPEHPYPAAIEDVERHIPEREIITAGDSAGGYIAAVLAQRHRVRAQVLICPALDPEAEYPDLDDYGLHRDEMRFFWDAFAPGEELDPRKAPPTVIVTAELDILCAEAERYAERLFNAGVPVISTRYQGMNHNFVRKLALFDAAEVAVAQIAVSIRKLTAGSTPD